MKIWLVFLVTISLLFAGCIYSFSGSTLPSNLKTIEVPLFEIDVNALVQGVAEQITEALSQKVSQEKLTPVARNGDAVIRGVVFSYSNTPNDYIGDRSNVEIKSYSVKIVVDIQFYDNKNDNEIYKGRIVSVGDYDFTTETEADGRTRAIEDLTEKIMQNSIQGW